jgi:hypothetical protein
MSHRNLPVIYTAYGADASDYEGMASTCCSTFMASCGVMAPLVMSSSSESVRAIPMLKVNKMKRAHEQH